jgi:probable HAF family extracellular repeat protein
VVISAKTQRRATKRALTEITASALSAISLLLTISAAKAGSYDFTEIDVPGATDTSAYGINNAGQVVGTFDTATRTSGFLYTAGGFSLFDAPGSATIANGINDAGQIVGWVQTGPAGLGQGFLYTGSTFSSITVPGAGYTNATGINNAGQVVGFYDNGVGGNGSGFLYSAGSFTSLNLGGPDTNTEPSAINNSGQIVGELAGPPHGQGFLYAGGVLTTINVPGALNTYVNGLNDNGQIVGWFSSNGPPNYQGFVDTGGSFETIDFPGAIDTQVYGINNVGQIVGSFEDPNGNFYGFLATPLASVPGPTVGAGLPGLLAGGAGLLWWLRKRQHARNAHFPRLSVRA